MPLLSGHLPELRDDCGDGDALPGGGAGGHQPGDGTLGLRAYVGGRGGCEQGGGRDLAAPGGAVGEINTRRRVSRRPIAPRRGMPSQRERWARFISQGLEMVRGEAEAASGVPPSGQGGRCGGAGGYIASPRRRRDRLCDVSVSVRICRTPPTGAMLLTGGP